MAESRWLPVALSVVAIFSVAWGVGARVEGYGPISERMGVLANLLRSDERLAYALVGDVVFFSLFQGWLVDDDLSRRLPAEDRSTLTAIVRYVPFFGLAYYLYARPALREEP